MSPEKALEWVLQANTRQMWERRCEQARSHIFDCISIRGQAMSRSSRRKILPTGVIGNDSRNTMCLGTLYPVKLVLQ